VHSQGEQETGAARAEKAGRGVAGRLEAREGPPLPAILALQRMAGNRATAAAVQRWYEPAAGAVVPPGSTTPAKAGIRWAEKNREFPDLYRYVDAAGQGWEAKGLKGQFRMSEWNKNPWWYNLTAKKWSNEPRPPGTQYRLAAPDERVSLQPEELQRRSFAAIADVPMLIAVKYKPITSTATDGRTTVLRMLDRIGRLLATTLPGSSSPHLAVSLRGGRLEVAGNTGRARVTEKERTQASELLKAIVGGGSVRTPNRRQVEDVRKLHALLSGDYAARRVADAGPLNEIKRALQADVIWLNVAPDRDPSAPEASEHGEMTLLRGLYEDWQRTPGDPQAPTQVAVGGVKKACGACHLAITAFNANLGAAVGHQVAYSGSHGNFYQGWMMPDFLIADQATRGAITSGLPDKSWFFNEQWELRKSGAFEDHTGTERPDDSGSEWE
jgi:hypothetical protein